MPSLSVRLLAASAAIGALGCWPLFTPTEQRRPAAPPVTGYSAPAATPAAAQDDTREKPVRRHTASRSSRPPAAASSPASQPQTAADAPAKPSITLAGEDHSESNAEQLLSKVDHRLDAIDRTKLNGTDLSTYDQANGFASSARQALADHDYVVASALAEKASALVGRLNTASIGH